jgi:hypothetical protein
MLNKPADGSNNDSVMSTRGATTSQQQQQHPTVYVGFADTLRPSCGLANAAPITVSPTAEGHENPHHGASEVVATAAAIPMVDADPETAWGTVWAEAKLLPPLATGLNTSPTHSRPTTHPTQQDDQHYPPSFIYPEVVTIDEPSTVSFSNSAAWLNQPRPPPTSGSNSGNNNETTKPSALSLPASLMICFTSPLGGVVGVSLFLASVATTLALEIAAGALYMVASLFYIVGNNSAAALPYTTLLYMLCAFIAAILLMVDTILCVWVSVLVTELLAAATGFICSFLGGLETGMAWHQYIRKINHLMRWAIRTTSAKWLCPFFPSRHIGSLLLDYCALTSESDYSYLSNPQFLADQEDDDSDPEQGDSNIQALSQRPDQHLDQGPQRASTTWQSDTSLPETISHDCHGQPMVAEGEDCNAHYHEGYPSQPVELAPIPFAKG